MKAEVIEELARIIGVEAGMISPDVRFAEQGVAAADVRRLAQKLAAGLECPTPKILWAIATPNALTELLVRHRPDTDEVFARLGFVPGLPDEMYYE